MVKVNYGALQTMSSTTSSASQARVAGYQQLINAFSTFSGSYELQGDGYDAARTYASGIMVSYYQACILYSEAVADAADYLADTYTALCGSESLDEEELQTEINNATRGSMQVSSSIASFERRDKLTDAQKASLESLRRQASELDEQIRVATEKLEHLKAFDAASASACTAANDAAGIIASAEHTLGVSFAARTFECTTSTDWATTVATKWEARAVNLQEAYDKALQKLYNGEELTESDLTAIERYNSEYPGVVDQEILQYTKEVRSLKAEEMRYRGVVDKVVEGKQLTSDERKFAKEFAAKYPDLEINTVILSTVERQENYKKIIEKANKGKELSAGELDFLINYYKDYPDVSVPKSVSKSLKNRKFENKISQSSLANLEENYGYAVKDYERYLNTGQYVYTKGGVTLQEAAYIYSVYNLKKSSGEDTLQVRTDKKKMFANLRASDKKKIDSKTLEELSSEHIEFMTGRTSIEFDYIVASDADKAKKDYEYYRFNELMKKQPIDWRDPDYMNKRNQYILKTGKNPSTGEKATKDEIFVAKNYGWVKGTTDVATGTIDLLDNLGIFQLAMAKISRPKIDTSKIVKKINKSDTATVPNTHTNVKTPKIKPAKSVDLEVPVKPKVDVEVPKIKPVEAVAGAATAVPKSKKPDIDVLTKPKDLSTIKGEAVDHVGTAKPKVDLDVPEVKDVHDVEVPKYNREQIKEGRLLEESELVTKKQVPDFVTRNDNDFYDQYNYKGNLKAYINEAGYLVPANPEGDVSIHTQVRGSSPEGTSFISTTDPDFASQPKDYGSNKLTINTKKIQHDIEIGKLKNIEVITHQEIVDHLQKRIDQAQVRYNNNPSKKNSDRLTFAKRDLFYVERDNEVLIKVKGGIPPEYFTFE